jgi:hypothetical protein
MGVVRFAFAGSLLGAFGACGATSPPPRAAAIANTSGEGDTVPPLTGAYHDRHEIMVVCGDNPDGWCAEMVSDSLILREGDAGGVYVAIGVLQTNAHSCTFEGELTARDPAELPAGVDEAWRVVEPARDDGDGGCTLDLARTGAELVITSEGCRDYCGARASLDASFSTATWSPIDDGTTTDPAAAVE